MSNEELQKAIDDITKENTDATAIAPAVPVEDAPAGDVPEAVMPNAETPAPEAAPAAEAPVDPIAPPPAAPEMPPMPPEMAVPTSDVTPVETPAAEAAPAATETAPAEAPAPEAVPAAQPDLGEGVTIGADGLIDVNPVEATEKTSNIPTEEPPANLIKVKQDTLRELFPLMNKLNIDPVEKFGIYKDIIDLTKEHEAIEEAHEVVLQIQDEQTRADALLELLEIIATFKV